MIAGMEPSGTSTEQINEAAASADRRPGGGLGTGAGGGGDAGAGEICGTVGDADCGTGAGWGAGGLGAAAGMAMVFWQVGQLICAPPSAESAKIFWPHSGQRNLNSLMDPFV